MAYLLSEDENAHGRGWWMLFSTDHVVWRSCKRTGQQILEKSVQHSEDPFRKTLPQCHCRSRAAHQLSYHEIYFPARSLLSPNTSNPVWKDRLRGMCLGMSRLDEKEVLTCQSALEHNMISTRRSSVLSFSLPISVIHISERKAAKGQGESGKINLPIQTEAWRWWACFAVSTHVVIHHWSFCICNNTIGFLRTVNVWVI